MVRHNVEFCKNESCFMPFFHFSFESYSYSDDKNQYKTIFISHVKNKSRGLFHLNCKPMVQCWFNARSPTSHAYANVMSTILFQVLRWSNVAPTLFKGTIYNNQYNGEIWFSLLCVVPNNNSFNKPLLNSIPLAFALPSW